MSNPLSEAWKQVWSDPELGAALRDKISKAASRRYEDPEERRKASERSIRLYEDPEFRLRNREHLARLNAARRGQPGSAGGRCASPEYKVWGGMIQRCHNPRSPAFPNYGGRGVRVCDEWRGRGGFARFFEHVGPRPSPDMTVDRIDNDRGYEPGNVRWATRLEQSINSRRVRMVTIGGETRHLAEWAKIAGVDPPTLSYRIRAGWPEDRLLSPARQL